MKNVSVFLIISIICCLSACQKEEQLYSIVPKLEFKKIEILKNKNGLDSSISITVYFEDGDGDLGLSQSDTLPPYNDSSYYYYNMFIDYYREYEDTFIQGYIDEFGDTNQIKHYNRFKVITPKGRNKGIKGNLEYTVPKGGVFPGRIKYRIFIVDRMRHHSDTVFTTPVTYKLK